MRAFVQPETLEGRDQYFCEKCNKKCDAHKVSRSCLYGAQWLSGRVLDFRRRGCRYWTYQCHCVVSLSKSIYPCLVLVQPRKTPTYLKNC